MCTLDHWEVHYEAKELKTLGGMRCGNMRSGNDSRVWQPFSAGEHGFSGGGCRGGRKRSETSAELTEAEKTVRVVGNLNGLSLDMGNAFAIP